MITICMTHFKSLKLANLAAALYSVRRQDLSRVKELVLVDNNSDDSVETIQSLLDELKFPCSVALRSVKHGLKSRTHAWSSNYAISWASESWIFFTRSDYILHFDMLAKLVARVYERSENWNGFIVSNGCHLGVDVNRCEETSWRADGTDALLPLGGATYDHTLIDAGVWLGRRAGWEFVGGFEERLSAWGHAQTEFQAKLHEFGTEFVRVPEVLFWHPWHAGDRNIDLAHEQLKSIGKEPHDLWRRYEGANPY